MVHSDWPRTSLLDKLIEINSSLSFTNMERTYEAIVLFNLLISSIVIESCTMLNFVQPQLHRQRRSIRDDLFATVLICIIRHLEMKVDM